MVHAMKDASRIVNVAWFAAVVGLALAAAAPVRAADGNPIRALERVSDRLNDYVGTHGGELPSPDFLEQAMDEPWRSMWRAYVRGVGSAVDGITVTAFHLLDFFTSKILGVPLSRILGDTPGASSGSDGGGHNSLQIGWVRPEDLPGANTGGTTQAPTTPRVVVVRPTREQWIDAGVVVGAGQRLTIRASGVTEYGYEGPPLEARPSTTPDGRRYINGRLWEPKSDPNATTPSAPIGALVARLRYPNGADQPFTARTYYSTTVRSDGGPRGSGGGRLEFMYNDCPGSYADNTGAYIVSVVVDGQPGTSGTKTTLSQQCLSEIDRIARHAGFADFAARGRPLEPCVYITNDGKAGPQPFTFFVLRNGQIERSRRFCLIVNGQEWRGEDDGDGIVVVDDFLGGYRVAPVVDGRRYKEFVVTPGQGVWHPVVAGTSQASPTLPSASSGDGPAAGGTVFHAPTRE